MDELKATLLPEGSSSGASSSSNGLHKDEFRLKIDTQSVTLPLHSELTAWMYPARGETEQRAVPIDELSLVRGHMSAPKHKLSEWRSTSICGNDILASVLYSSGIVAAKAGKLMPLTQVLVAVVLYLFRYIYEEAVTAIPLNGGSYNVLLNTTSKRTAAVAATLGIISYLATGVVSGTSAIQYLNTQIELPVVWWTIALLLAFACLSIVGIAESSTVALMIFVLHVITLTLLSVCSLVYAFQHPHVLLDNMKTDFPSVNVAGDVVRGNVLTAIFFGYSSAMLGITGFETSAQFVEEQERGVFRKTLRNMWVFATFYNVLLSFLSLAVLPLDSIYSHKDIVLAHMGRVVCGAWLEQWVSLDAFVVLSGGVLTSYVGITGLVRRLSCDRVLPAFLAHTNSCRGTNHYIILLFFALQASLVILLKADATILAGVFTFAFLGVMALFAFGCMLLKLKREEVPRDVHAPWWSCVFGLVMVLLGLLGNILGDPAIFTYFALYFIVFASVMFLMLERVFILRILLFFMHRLCGSSQKTPLPTAGGACGGRTIMAVLQSIHLPPIVFFCKAPDLSLLNKAILYVRTNEQTQNLRVVHVHEALHASEMVTQADHERFQRLQATLQELHDMVRMFDTMYPKLKVDLVTVAVPGGHFDSAVVQWVSQSLQVPANMMFIRQPGTKHIHEVTTLGVRIITG